MATYHEHWVFASTQVNVGREKSFGVGFSLSYLVHKPVELRCCGYEVVAIFILPQIATNRTEIILTILMVHLHN